MTDPLLDFYDRELAFFHQMSGEYAERYPKIAARLQLGSGGTTDPHVERMIQAFALMNARIRHKLDDDFPELTQSLLNVIYPHYVAPIPSVSIVQFVHDRKQGDLTGGYDVPRGTPLECRSPDGTLCTYRTAYPVTIWPIELKSATFSVRPFAAPNISQMARAQSLLRLDLATLSSAVSFKMLRPRSLRFYISLPQLQYAAALHELLMACALDVVVAKSPEDREAVSLGAKSIRPVGFERDEGLFPFGPRSFSGYRLLTEYFTFPRKFLFFDLVDIPAAAWDRLSDRASLYVYFEPENEELGRLVSNETVRMGCTPIVNLFPQKADPIVITHRQAEYRIVPDARGDEALEIYSIERVLATSPGGEETEYLPFYSAKHADRGADRRTFWHATRRPRRLAEGAAENEGTDVYLALVDLAFSTQLPADWTLHVETTCLNRRATRSAIPREGKVPFRMPEGQGPISDILCLVLPTPTRFPELKRLLSWRLISHLSLNYLSLDVKSANVSALQEVLRLYDIVASADTRDVIDGILDIQCQRGVARVGGAAGGFCRGLDVSLLLDEEKFTGSGPHLFASILSHFFGLYVSINSYARLRAATVRKRDKGEVWTWPPRAGERQLL